MYICCIIIVPTSWGYCEEYINISFNTAPGYTLPTNGVEQILGVNTLVTCSISRWLGKNV